MIRERRNSAAVIEHCSAGTGLWSTIANHCSLYTTHTAGYCSNQYVPYILDQTAEREEKAEALFPSAFTPLRQRIQVPRCAGGCVDKCHFRNIVGRCPIDVAELVSVVGCLYLNFDHVMSSFSLLLDH
jgi:hypothetical protein